MMANLVTRKAFVLDICEFFSLYLIGLFTIFFDIGLQGFFKKVYERYSPSMLEQSLEHLCILHIVSSLCEFKNKFK